MQGENMPINVETNFCKNGYAFAKQKQLEGATSNCFSPTTEWFGSCTNIGGHSLLCFQLFHLKKFRLPLQVCHSVVDAMPKNILYDYIKHQLNTPDDLAYFASRGDDTVRTLVKKKFLKVIKSNCRIKSKTLRKLCRFSAICAQAFQIAMEKLEDGIWENLVCLLTYQSFLIYKTKMPSDFHTETLAAAKDILNFKQMPLEIEQLILSYVFYKPQGLHI